MEKQILDTRPATLALFLPKKKKPQHGTWKRFTDPKDLNVGSFYFSSRPLKATPLFCDLYSNRESWIKISTFEALLNEGGGAKLKSSKGCPRRGPSLLLDLINLEGGSLGGKNFNMPPLRPA